ncbi:Crp/Fnr family transcriptional regulator [Tenacibaculum sp. HL-MS23]|uniref:Crp/Fnr family transcriptional regulator n=1 Tax=unclassified Tenacibaculum TaxID=2635139 RepID=UPI001C4ED054|nr:MULTISPECIES: Crp/Fnr family transcriptional regulator [unclassified Tenacibaculum]QXP74014.1 Crp/Fnr family transcriptional regulator [Tenacibaculum sp. AHE14PA]QXP75618.1 Crp/Fnr family transcriptional regulator [Tenacibaculum sp. AHE15PA]WNW02176.1 Crp/Fnr family transcriptional regulator [Tenacibaculum sp. HL-MS23]
MNELSIILKELIELTESEWREFSKQLKRKEYKAKAILIEEGNTAESLYFIQSGLFRTYKNLDIKDITTYFACDNQFITVFNSFINQTTSSEILEVLEDSIIYEISFDSLTQLYKKSSKFEKFGRILAEKNHLCALERTLTMQTKSAKKRYLDFLKNYNKKITSRVPQYQIASFLGIAPESLSRIRKEIFIS